MLTFKKTLLTVALSFGVAGAVAVPAQAENGRNAAAAAGAIGGLAVGAAIVGSQRPENYPAPYAREVYDGPAYAQECHIERRKVPMEDGRWGVQRIRVCD